MKVPEDAEITINDENRSRGGILPVSILKLDGSTVNGFMLFPEVNF